MSEPKDPYMLEERKPPPPPDLLQNPPAEVPLLKRSPQ